MTDLIAPVTVGNIIDAGTKHFVGGAKVYLSTPRGHDAESLWVYGRHRGGGRYIQTFVQAHLVTNFRVQMTGAPGVIKHLGFTGEDDVEARRKIEEGRCVQLTERAAVYWITKLVRMGVKL